MAVVEAQYRELALNRFQQIDVPIPPESTTERHLVASLKGARGLTIQRAGNLVLLQGVVGWQAPEGVPTRVVFEIVREFPAGSGNRRLIFSVEDAIDDPGLALPRSQASFSHVDAPGTGEVRYFLYVRRVQGTGDAFLIGPVTFVGTQIRP